VTDDDPGLLYGNSIDDQPQRFLLDIPGWPLQRVGDALAECLGDLPPFYVPVEMGVAGVG